MARPRIRITLIDQKGEKGCHRGHKIGDSYDFDTEASGSLAAGAMEQNHRCSMTRMWKQRYIRYLMWERHSR